MKVLYISAFLLLLTHFALAQSSLDRSKLTDHYQAQELDEAINYLQQLHAADSNDVTVLNYLGYTYNLLEDKKNATKYYEKAVRADSTNIAANQNLASLLSNRFPYLSRQITLRLIRLQPGKPANYRQMGNLLVQENLRDSALDYFQAAYDLSPNDPKNAAALAEVLIDLKNYIKADRVISGGLMLDSMNVALLALSIRSAFETDQFDKTFDAGEKMMRLGEAPVKTLSQVMLSYYNLKKYTDCIRVAYYLRDQEIQNEAIIYYEARAWAKLKDYERSNELLHQCIQSALSKELETYYYALADNYEELGKYKTAIAHYDTAYYFFRDPLMTYNIGRIYETRLKNRTVAEKYFKRYLIYADTSTPDKKKVYHFLNRRYSAK